MDLGESALEKAGLMGRDHEVEQHWNDRMPLCSLLGWRSCLHSIQRDCALNHSTEGEWPGRLSQGRDGQGWTRRTHKGQEWVGGSGWHPAVKGTAMLKRWRWRGPDFPTCLEGSGPRESR